MFKLTVCNLRNNVKLTRVNVFTFSKLSITVLCDKEPRLVYSNSLQRTLVITTVFVTKDIAVKSNLLL